MPGAGEHDAMALSSRRQTETQAALIRVDGVSQRFCVERDWLGRPRRWVRALHRVSLDVPCGGSLGLVGESGCGKSSLARVMAGLDLPSDGRMLLAGSPYPVVAAERRRLVAPQVQMVFQDPVSSLNPKRTVLASLSAPLLALTELKPQGRRERILEVLDLVELPEQIVHRYPHQLSGGQAQRVCIARALAPRPNVIILDEAVSSLDVSIQASVLRLLDRLRRELGLAYVFIGHDLAVVEVLCEQVAVMYLGTIVEHGPTSQVLHEAKHPYTRSLRAAVPVLGRPSRPIALQGRPPSPTNPPAGCVFHTRCYRAEPRCGTSEPTLADGRVDRGCACFFAHDSEPGEQDWEHRAVVD